MSNDKKSFSAKDAALAVLAKTHELLAKSESLKKYQTENSPKTGVKYGALETKQVALERDFKDYEVKKQGSKEEPKRVAKQTPPSKNPKENAEGNNKPDGMEPDYEFKSKVPYELAKEKNKDLGKAEVLSKGRGTVTPAQHEVGRGVRTEPGLEHKGVHPGRSGWSKAGAQMSYDKPGAKETHKKVLAEMKAMPKPKLGKAENPDKDADAQLGEQVEKDVEEHMITNKDAEQKEGHEIMNKPDGQMEQAFIPAALVGSAKLSKFMERVHAKRKARGALGAESQAPAAVGNPAADAPAPGSTQAGQPKVK